MSRVDLAALDGALAAYVAEVHAALPALAAAAPPAPAGAERELLAEGAHARLWCYRAAGARAALLIVYAFVNRPAMLDLDERRSLIRRLLEQGLDVYLVEWREPDEGYAGLGLAECVDRVLPALLAAACAQAGRPALPVLGVCQGGTLSLMLAGRHPARVAGLVLLVTPVDFRTPEDALSRFARDVDFGRLAEAWRSLPAALLDHLFLALKPFELRVLKYREAQRLSARPGALDDFLRMEHWIFGGPRLSAAMLRDFAAACYQGNAFVSGTPCVAGEAVDLGRLALPVLNLYATADHLVPPAASQALAGLLTGADYAEQGHACGHIGIFVGRRAQDEIAGRIAAWLQDKLPALFGGEHEAGGGQ